MKKELFISVDVETNGPQPGRHSMWSLGAAAFSPDSTKPLDTFTENLRDLPGGIDSTRTMEQFWKRFPEAYKAARKDPKYAKNVMKRFKEWVEGFKNDGYSPTFVCAPTAFDFSFIQWYQLNYSEYCGFRCIDMRSFYMGMTGKRYSQTGKRNWKKEWKRGTPKHSHIAVDDAIEQGIIFINMLNHCRNNMEKNDVLFR